MSRYLFILLLALTLPVRANMGETVAECVKRYGKPVGFSEASAKNPFGTVVFTAANYTLIVFLLNTKEVGARVSKTDKSSFTDAEMKNIMAADSAGSGWTVAASDDPTCLRWARADQATALYDKVNHVMIFTSPEMTAAIRANPPAASPPPKTPSTNAPSAPPPAPAGA